MRLLFFNSDTLCHQVFTGTIPPYAILSHRWGDEEFTFDDLVGQTGRNKEGYRKIEFCAKQAAQDQLRYFWVDTCSINQLDILERQKAINSMFLWYKKAAKCYVFLSDVSVSTPEEALLQRRWEASFRKSQWFTRGWTLQELIAPRFAEFFSFEGHRLGDKESLEQMLHDITSIPVEALQNHTLDKFSVSERMQWASGRKTTEPEDSVYCLLGLLDIFMLLSYGEGKDKALERLLLELETSKNAPFIVPFSRNSRYIGQESMLAKLQEKVVAGGSNRKIAITGLGGIGKSQLSLELAYRIKRRYNNYSVF